MMLHVAEFENLLLHLLPGSSQLLSFIVELVLDIINIAVQRGNRLLQVVNFLVLLYEFTLVGLNIIHQNGLV